MMNLNTERDIQDSAERLECPSVIVSKALRDFLWPWDFLQHNLVRNFWGKQLQISLSLLTHKPGESGDNLQDMTPAPPDKISLYCIWKLLHQNYHWWGYSPVLDTQINPLQHKYSESPKNNSASSFWEHVAKSNLNTNPRRLTIDLAHLQVGLQWQQKNRKS